MRSLLEGLKTRRRADFLNTRTQLKGKKRRLRIDGIKALPPSEQQRALIDDFMATFAMTQPQPDFYKVLDVARHIAGTGSLGVDRYAVLVKGKGSPDGKSRAPAVARLASELIASVTQSAEDPTLVRLDNNPPWKDKPMAYRWSAEANFFAGGVMAVLM